MRQHLHLLDPFCDYLVVTQAEINDGCYITTLNYQNGIYCIPYMIRQVTYRSDRVSEPIREYNSSWEGLYAEMHTVDW